MHVFAGRGPYRAVTEFVNKSILTELALGPSDLLVDVGCGDGSLLKLASQSGVKGAIGLSATEDEARELRGIGLDVRQGLSDSLPLSSGIATAVVCNSVLLIVPEKRILASLLEIARIAKTNALVWIGEIPRMPEPPNTPRHHNIPQMLWWLLRNRGVRTLFGMIRRLITGEQKGPILVNPLAAIFWASPEAFIDMAQAAGLACERHFPHQTLDGNQKACVHGTRHDYIFRKK